MRKFQTCLFRFCLEFVGLGGGSFVAPERNRDGLGQKDPREQRQGGQFRGGGCFTTTVKLLKKERPLFSHNGNESGEH